MDRMVNLCLFQRSKLVRIYAEQDEFGTDVREHGGRDFEVFRRMNGEDAGLRYQSREKPES